MATWVLFLVDEWAWFDDLEDKKWRLIAQWAFEPILFIGGLLYIYSWFFFESSLSCCLVSLFFYLVECWENVKLECYSWNLLRPWKLEDHTNFWEMILGHPSLFEPYYFYLFSSILSSQSWASTLTIYLLTRPSKLFWGMFGIFLLKEGQFDRRNWGEKKNQMQRKKKRRRRLS